MGGTDSSVETRIKERIELCLGEKRLPRDEPEIFWEDQKFSLGNDLAKIGKWEGQEKGVTGKDQGGAGCARCREVSRVREGSREGFPKGLGGDEN